MDDYLFFFEKMPGAIPLYETVRDFICSELDDVNIKVHRTQISFSNKHGFAYVWLPPRSKIKGRPDVYIVLTFGLNRQETHQRIEVSVEPYPGRWTHHVVIQNVEEVDAQIKEWVREAYSFSMIK
jgi:hypothetical protein